MGPGPSSALAAGIVVVLTRSVSWAEETSTARLIVRTLPTASRTVSRRR